MRTWKTHKIKAQERKQISRGVVYPFSNQLKPLTVQPKSNSCCKKAVERDLIGRSLIFREHQAIRRGEGCGAQVRNLIPQRRARALTPCDFFL